MNTKTQFITTNWTTNFYYFCESTTKAAITD